MHGVHLHETRTSLNKKPVTIRGFCISSFSRHSRWQSHHTYRSAYTAGKPQCSMQPRWSTHPPLVPSQVFWKFSGLASSLSWGTGRSLQEQDPGNTLGAGSPGSARPPSRRSPGRPCVHRDIFPSGTLWLASLASSASESS
jgi:hypothetical protein